MGTYLHTSGGYVNSRVQVSRIPASSLKRGHDLRMHLGRTAAVGPGLVQCGEKPLGELGVRMAARAFSEVVLHGFHAVGREFSVHIVPELLHGRTELALACRQSSCGSCAEVPAEAKPASWAYTLSFSCNCRRPRKRRDRTVPTGTPSTSDAASYDWSSTSTRMTADLNGSASSSRRLGQRGSQVHPDSS